MNKKQALGYLLLSMKESDLSYRDMEILYKKFTSIIDSKSEKEAESEGIDWWKDYSRREEERIEQELHSKISLKE